MAKEARKEKKEARKEKRKQKKNIIFETEEKKTQKSESGTITFSVAHPAKVEEVIGRTGTRGEIAQVRCKILDGPDQGKVIRRNVKGPVRLDDVLMLRETEIEARKLMQVKRGS